MDIRIIGSEVVSACLDMPRAIDLMAMAYVDLTEGNLMSPLRSAITNDRGTVLYKPAYSDTSGIFCVKVVSVFPDNAQNGLPVTPGIIVINSSETGMPLAVLEAGYLTSLRTGAATGLATKIFARAESKVGALFGTGGQARHQLEAMLCVRAFQRIYLFSRDIENARRFCVENQDLAGACELIANPDRSVLKDCDVITTATTSPDPVFRDKEINDSVHINAIGSLGAERSEVSADTLLRSDVIVDQRAACLKEAGEICLMRTAGLIGEDYQPREIGEILNGYALKPCGDRPTVFKSVGNAAQDLVCAAEIYHYALTHGLGGISQF